MTALELVMYHDGESGEINENEKLLDMIHHMNEEVEERRGEGLYEMYDQMVFIWLIKSEWFIYVTVPDSESNAVSGYLYKTSSQFLDDILRRGTELISIHKDDQSKVFMEWREALKRRNWI